MFLVISRTHVCQDVGGVEVPVVEDFLRGSVDGRLGGGGFTGWVDGGKW